MGDFFSQLKALLSGDAEPFEMPRQGPPQMSAAPPLSWGKKIGQKLFGEDALGEYELRQLKDRDQLATEQESYDAAPSLTAAIPGGNPEAGTGMDAMMGLAMSGGGVPSSVARSGEATNMRPPGSRRMGPKGGMKQAQEEAYWEMQKAQMEKAPKTEAEARRRAEMEASDYYAGKGPDYEREMNSVRNPNLNRRAIERQISNWMAGIR